LAFRTRSRHGSFLRAFTRGIGVFYCLRLFFNLFFYFEPTVETGVIKKSFSNILLNNYRLESREGSLAELYYVKTIEVFSRKFSEVLNTGILYTNWHYCFLSKR